MLAFRFRFHAFPNLVNTPLRPALRQRRSALLRHLRAIMMSGADPGGSTVPDKRPVDASRLSGSDSKRAKIHPEIVDTASDAAGSSQSKSVLDAESTLAAEAQPEGRKNKFATRRESAGYAKSRKNREKDTKNVGRRSGRGTRRNDETVKEGSEGENADKAPRLPKRQCALLIGFCGTGCSGMQMCVFSRSTRPPVCDLARCVHNASVNVDGGFAADSQTCARLRACCSRPW